MPEPHGLDTRIGTEFLGYRFEALVRRGGMGVVYRAYDLRLKRNVALKLIAPEYAEDERFRERFLTETELAASLEHPDVVPIYDAGEVDGQLYLALRFVEGTDLKRVITAEAPLEPTRTLALVARVADALDAAHERGLVHRDVKPSNVLLDEREHPYLADFGLTRRLDDPGSPTAGLSVGTPAYVAPEQIRGDEVDGRADQYALACMLHECLTGEPPFRRPSEVAMLFAHLEDPPRPLGGPLDPVFAKALAKDPAERYVTCGEFVHAAREALGLVETRARRWPLLLVAVVLAVVAAGLAAVLLTRGPGSQMPETTGRLIRIDTATNAAETISVGNDPSAIAAGASGVWVANRGDGSLWRVDPDRNEVELKVSAHGPPADLAVHSDRVVVANGPLEAKIAVIDPETGVQRTLFSLAHGQFFGSATVAASESGVWVATGDRRVGRLNVLTGELIDPTVIPQPPAERSDSVFSGIAVAEGAVWVIGDPLDHSLYRIDAATGDLAATIRLPFAPTDVAAGESAVWVTSYLEDTLARIDPARNAVAGTVAVGRGAYGLAVGAASVWVANAIDGSVSRVDPRTLRVETIDVEGNPNDVAVREDAVWLSASVGTDPAPVDAVTIGVLADCEGTWGYASPVSYAGAELPLLDRGATSAGPRPVDGLDGARVAGRDVVLVFGCADDSAQDGLYEARRLVELHGVDVVIGPYYEGEAMAIRDYAKTRPDATFVNGIASSQSPTLYDPAPNYFRFLPDAAQWQAGVGQYARDTLGWERVVTIGDARTFQYAETAGFVAEFCALGGNIAEQIWVPLGTTDLAPFIANVPQSGVDGFFITADPPTALAFFAGLPQLKRQLREKMVGTIALVVPPIPETLGARLAGVVLGAPDDTETRSARAFVTKFTRAFPDLGDEGFFFGAFYADAMEAVLRALEAVGGDLSNGQRRFQEALARVELDTPTAGHIHLDERRQAIGTTYLVQFGFQNGQVTFKTLSVAKDVEQTFGGYFDPKAPPPSTNEIPCKRGNPPPWTRD